MSTTLFVRITHELVRFIIVGVGVGVRICVLFVVILMCAILLVTTYLLSITSIYKHLFTHLTFYSHPPILSTPNPDYPTPHSATTSITSTCPFLATTNCSSPTISYSFIIITLIVYYGMCLSCSCYSFILRLSRSFILL